MNLLAHLYLADATRTSKAGALLGDRVKGPLKRDYPASLEVGIQLHRRIDSYTDQHRVVRHLCRRFEPPYRRYAGILTDVYFDHVLANQWADWHDDGLARFCDEAQQAVADEWPHPPLRVDRLDTLSALLQSYRSTDGVRRSLAYLASAGRRARLPDGAFAVVRGEHAAIQTAFGELFPDLLAFARREADVIGSRYGIEAAFSPQS